MIEKNSIELIILIKKIILNKNYCYLIKPH